MVRAAVVQPRSYRMQTPLAARSEPFAVPRTSPTSNESSPNAVRVPPAPLPPPEGLRIPLYAEPAKTRPAVYRLEENGRTFVLRSRDMHVSHAPLRHKHQHAIAADPSRPPAQVGGWSTSPSRLSRALSEPRALGTVLRRTVWPEDLPEPAEAPPPVVFGFEPCAEDSLRRSIPPAAENLPPPPPPPGYARSPSRSPARSAHSRRRPPPTASPLPLPRLLREVAGDFDEADKHQQVLLNLFAQHELAMEVAMANSEKRGAKPAKPPACARVGPARGSVDRLLIERDEMAMRRKLLLRPQSLTYA